MSFDELLFQAAQQALELDELETEAFAESNYNRYWSELLKTIDRDRALGRLPLFHYDDQYFKKVEWLPWYLRQGSSRLARRKGVRLASRPSMLCTIDELSERQYEVLGCVVAKLLDARHLHLTPRGNEAGVDSFVLMGLNSKSHVFGPAGGQFRLVIQSKKTGRSVPVDEMKEFITTLHDIRHNNPIIGRHIPAWFRVSDAPIVGWFISHNGVQSGAANKAREHGIVVSDSIDLAEIAALSRSLDEHLDASSRAQSLNVLVQELLDSYEEQQSA